MEFDERTTSTERSETGLWTFFVKKPNVHDGGESDSSSGWWTP
jgi:hypothetical protein